MKRDEDEDPSKKIPEGFEDFAKSKMCLDLLQAMLDYNLELARLEKK